MRLVLRESKTIKMPRTNRLALTGPKSAVDKFAEAFPTVEHYLVARPNDWKADDLNQEQIDGVLSIPLNFLESVAPSVQSGITLVSNRNHDALLPTGCRAIDRLLQGGFVRGQLMELVGASSTGKTQLCHTMAASTALGHRVLFIDTSNSFSAQRIDSLLANESQTALNRVLDRITVFKNHSVTTVLALLDDLYMQMKQIPKAQWPVLLVLDSVSAIVAPVLGSVQSPQGHTLMVALGRQLKVMAQEFGMGVVCTNHEVGGPDNCRPALGENWRNQPHGRIQLQLVDEADSVYCATVKMSKIGAQEASVKYTITNDGMKGV